jgi:hypothetical protein
LECMADNLYYPWLIQCLSLAFIMDHARTPYDNVRQHGQ